jgi:hypothetical protein
MLAHRDTVTVYGAHDAAKALRNISKTMGAWKEAGGGLSVHVRDGDAKDERARDVARRGLQSAEHVSQATPARVPRRRAANATRRNTAALRPHGHR